MKNIYFINGLLLLSIIGLYLFLNSPNKLGNYSSQSISSLHFNDIQTIQVQRNEITTIELQKQDQQWLISYPITAHANPIKIKLLLSILNAKTYNQIPIANINSLAQFKLSPPAFTLKLNQHRFDFGDIESLNKYRYLQYKDIIYLIDDTIAPLLNSNANSFINNRLIGDNKKIIKLDLPLFDGKKLSNATHNIEQIDGHWQAKIPFSADELTALIANWQHAYALQVIPLQDNISGQTIRIWFEGDADPHNFIIQHNEHRLFIADPINHLNYQFPLDSLPTLFLEKPEDNA